MWLGCYGHYLSVFLLELSNKAVFDYGYWLRNLLDRLDVQALFKGFDETTRTDRSLDLSDLRLYCLQAGKNSLSVRSIRLLGAGLRPVLTSPVSQIN